MSRAPARSLEEGPDREPPRPAEVVAPRERLEARDLRVALLEVLDLVGHGLRAMARTRLGLAGHH